MKHWLSCLLIVLHGGSRLDAAPENDAFESPIVLRGAEVHVTDVTTVGATAQAGEPGHGGQPAVRSVWWFWAAPARGEALLDFSATDFAYRVGVYRGKELASLASIPLRTNYVPGLLRFDAEAGVEYQIAVDGQGSSSGPVDFGLRLVRTPEILRAPEGVSAYQPVKESGLGRSACWGILGIWRGPPQYVGRRVLQQRQIRQPGPPPP